MVRHSPKMRIASRALREASHWRGDTMTLREFEETIERLPGVNSRVNMPDKPSITHMYSFPELPPETDALTSKLPDARCWNIETRTLVGSFLQVGDHSILLFQPNRENFGLEHTFFNQSIEAQFAEELQAFAAQNDIPGLRRLNSTAFGGLQTSYFEAVRRIYSMSWPELLKLKAHNSLLCLIDHHRSLSNPHLLPLSSNSHLRAFSWIYYVQLRAIADVFAGKDGPIIHDVASNTGHLPLLISSLTREELFGIEYSGIYCSDVSTRLIRTTLQSVRESEERVRRPIAVSRLDLLGDLSALKSADVITANDVLEHFEDKDSFKLLENLWAHTKKLLLVHVPVEETPTKAYGHLTSFNSEKLAEWASHLPECENITPRYALIIEQCDAPSNRDGFLLLQRNG